MSKCKCFFGFLAPLCLVLFLTAGGAFSQPPQSDSSSQGMDQSGRMSGARGQQGSGQDREQMEQRMIERFKEVLECSDEEWQVIGPKILSVYKLSNQSRTGSTRTIMGRGNQGNRSDSRRSLTSGDESDESLTKLQELLENKNATASDIKKIVSEVRKAREKSQQELAMAQKELRELLTVRQEAILITLGILD